jgi:predicted Ser/Thr protein kinase
MVEALLIAFLSILATGGIAGAVYLYSNNKNLRKQIHDKKFLSLTEEEAIEKASLKAKNTILERCCRS